MPDAPEIPEAKDPFEKQVAISIAGLAAVLSVVGNKGDNAKTDAIIKTNEATNKFAHYQAKGIKGSIASAEEEMLTLLAPSQSNPAEIAKNSERLKASAQRYKEEQVGILSEANQAQKDAEIGSRINDRCDMSSLALQIAIVIASVAILSRWRALWFVSLALGALGIAIGVTAFLIS